MESVTDSMIRSIERSRKDLEKAINSENATDANIESSLASYRSASETLIFHDYGLAGSLNTEKCLWQLHIKVNTRFRKILTALRKEKGKRRVVERRKSEIHYVSFIKSSQGFYRRFIQRLASHFANVDKVLEVAHRIKLKVLSVNKPMVIDAQQRQLVVQSCHASLVQLGDLSRYRETELQATNRNWVPARNYYKLAILVLPTSGSPYNQLAVIAHTDQDALEATYCLYRASMIEPRQPGPQADAERKLAEDNLQTDFNKILVRWEKPENHRTKDGIFMRFQYRFVFFHAKCYAGVDFEEHRDLETELIHEITVILVQKADAALLNKICLINIAAEAAAFERFASKADYVSMNSFHLLQSFNVKVFSQLLHALVNELEKVQKRAESSEMADNEKLTPLVQNLLPSLRQHSSWLLAEVPALVILDAQARESAASTFLASLEGQIQELWSVYVHALAALAKTYPLKGGKTLKYLLAEDEDTIAFKPFTDPLVQTRYLDEAGNPKARLIYMSAAGQEPAEEMLHRVRQIVKDGMTIAKATDLDRRVPVRLREGRFVFLQPKPRIPENSGKLPAPKELVESVEESQSLPPAPEQDTCLLSMDTVMQDMVDDLVGNKRPNTTELERPASQHDSTVGGRKRTLTAADLILRPQRSSQKPSSPSQLRPGTEQIIGSSPFPSSLEDLTTKPGSFPTSHFLETPVAKSPRSSSGHSFTNQLIRQKQEIHARSSPKPSLSQPSVWSQYETPSEFKSLLNAQVARQRSPSLSSTSATPMEKDNEGIQKPLSRKNLFGAIGETPGRTPTSAQPS